MVVDNSSRRAVADGIFLEPAGDEVLMLNGVVVTEQWIVLATPFEMLVDLLVLFI